MLKPVIGFFESIIVIIVVLFGMGQFVPVVGDYLTQLDRMDIYANQARCSVPATIVYDVIWEHFEAARDDGKAPKALVIAYDGARADALVNMVEGASGILALQEGGGKVYNMYVGGPSRIRPSQIQGTDTAQGFAAMLTGVWAQSIGGRPGNGVTHNGVRKPKDAPPILFNALLEAELVESTSFIVSWNGHFGTHTNPTYIYDVEYAVANSLNAQYITAANDAATRLETLAAIGDPNGPDLIFNILEHVDSAGHGSGFGNYSPRYVEAFRTSDRYGLDFINAVHERPSYANEDWLILIVSDHGGIATGHGPQFAIIRQVFVAANKDMGW